jgi:hypothetical protein
MTTATKTAIVPNQTINIVKGAPSSPSVTIPSEGVVKFNADNQDYLLEFFDRYNDRHTATYVYLAASSSIFVVGGTASEDQNATSYYNVLSYGAKAEKPKAAGGGNKIIIGSGTTDEKRK